MRRRWDYELMRTAGAIVALVTGIATGQAKGQSAAQKTGGSANITMLAHLPLNGYFSVGGMDIESELSRPYVYLERMFEDAGFSIISIADPANPKIIYDWRVKDIPLHSGLGGEAGRYFKRKGRYYFAKAYLWDKGTLEGDVGAVVFDVTGLPAVAGIKEVARVKEDGGFIDVFPYRHSDGRVLLFGSPWERPAASVYDVDKLLSGDANEGLISRVPVPQGNMRQLNLGYHDIVAAYDPATKRDRFYGAGTGGFHVFDITQPEQPRFLFSLSGGPGVISYGHTLAPSNDGRYAIAFSEIQYWPVLVFDLKPGLDGQLSSISSPIGGWAADWRNASHTGAILWPYAFTAAFEDGLQVINLVNPREPTTEAWYHTCICAHQTGFGGIKNPHGTSVFNGGADVVVRNADGLIAFSDYTSGFWTFRMDGFNGWNGKQWKVPNISREQDWDGRSETTAR